MFLICSSLLVCFIFLAGVQGWFSYLFLALFLLYFLFFFFYFFFFFPFIVFPCIFFLLYFFLFFFFFSFPWAAQIKFGVVGQLTPRSLAGMPVWLCP